MSSQERDGVAGRAASFIDALPPVFARQCERLHAYFAAPVRCQQGKETTGSAGPAFAAHEIWGRSEAIQQTAMDSAGTSCLSSPRGMQSIAATKPKRAASFMGENADEHFKPSLECGAAAGGA